MTGTATQRSYRFRCYPTPGQADNLSRTFGCVRLVYNKALDYRTKAWFRRRERVGYNQSSSMLTVWKRRRDLAFLNEVSSVPLQQGLRHLQKGFAGFFEGRTAYPTFKKKRSLAGSAEYTKSAFTWREGALKLAKHTAPLRIKWSRPLPKGAEPTSVTVSRDAAGRWFVSLLIEEDIPSLPRRSEAVGVDAGITSLLTLSTGEKITNPRHERRDRERIKRRQRDLARKEKGSSNHRKAQLRLARAHARVADRRYDFLHKLTTRLVRENQTIAIEDLNVRGMLSNHTLARAVSDASWATFRRLLEYKAAWYGRQVIAIDRFWPSTKTCSACGGLNDAVPLAARTFICQDPDCGHIEDRDVNAAKNILAAGLAVAACGDGVRPKRS
ncbi:RNA-guided endonuclease InsQ/TnpB family protein [Glycomyces niveus]|uniref:Transposase n=1 Tax=Glycomyces niveus TaxID=2820287 RepID=A0ABS3UAL4_9ACTN|nr:RNA-guided endonuclease TnpB family protein [Glycomyces sp. NEAU-S30]MBO3735819.1 transposase [Glycomyces sp. NEAU-S30]